MTNLSVNVISNDLISALGRGDDISEQVTGLKKSQVEEIRQYSDTQLLILDSRLRSLITRNDAMRGRRPISNDEIQAIEKEISLFTALRSKMSELL